MHGFQLEGQATTDRHEEFVAPTMAPFARTIVDEARVAVGASVLDLVCGTGFAALVTQRLRTGADGGATVLPVRSARVGGTC